MFAEFEPDLFLGCTYSVDRAVYKCIASRPQMRVALFASAWGHYLRDVNLEQYPLVVVTEQEKRTIEQLKKQTGRPDFVFIHAHGPWLEGTLSGWKEIGVDTCGILNAADVFVYANSVSRPELACDIGFVGGYWPYKARNLDRYLLPLCHPQKGLNIRIFGNQPWPVHSYLGTCDDRIARDLFASATVCPNISEPHSTDLGWDVVERVFKVPAAGGLLVCDAVQEAIDLFGDDLLVVISPFELEEAVQHFKKNPHLRQHYIKRMQERVLIEHTYHHRVATMLNKLDMPDEAEKCILHLKSMIGSI
jgi:hypothetical protein